MQHKLLTTFIFGITVLTSSLSGVAVFLENNYGAKLNFKISSLQPEGQYIGHNVRVLLGDINAIPELSIRTTGIGSTYLSPYSSLNVYLTDIKNQQARHSNEDAIIAIGSSSSYTSPWNISLAWEPKGKIKSFETADFPTMTGAPKVNPNPSQPLTQPAQLDKELVLMEANTAEERLNHIKNGALGYDYARKATEICSANYAQAEKLGKINLCAELKRNLMAPVYRKKKGLNPDLAPAIDDIKRSIDTLYGALGRYKTRGEAQ
jgi:hypothetical protein